MSDIIQLLPESVANQIAAGEVIQRPASVIKELVENAVDAGATQIKIILRDAGKTLIQVVDNGCGMSENDARLAFERHATSKIRAAADLFELHTMGFRGEALPSIAAVAQIELRTMRPGDAMGTHLQIAASRFESQQPEVCTPGTNLMVKNIFFNFPARRKFLKKDTVELTHILHEFERLALVNPGIEFLLVHNDITLHQLLPAGLKQRIADLFGRALDRQLLPVDTETALVKIHGFVSLPENARRRNALQYLFVNGRNMRHPYFHKAVVSCYEELIAPDMQPNYFLNFEVDPQTIDVNIHPTKSEIKFENEVPIWQILSAAVKEGLGKFNAVPSIDFDTTGRPDIPVFDPTATTPMPEGDGRYNPFACNGEGASLSGSAQGFQSGTTTVRAAAGNYPRTGSGALSNWEKLYQQFRNASPEDYLPATPPTEAAVMPSSLNAEGAGELGAREEIEAQAVNALRVAQRYIVTPGREGLIIVDQHRAHVKVLYERFVAAQEREGTFPSQQVLFAETLTLSGAQNAVLLATLSEVERVGFRVTQSQGGEGESEWSIEAVPSVGVELNARETLLKIIDDATFETEAPATQLRRRIALSLAQAAAIPAGQVLTAAETERLLSDLFTLPEPTYTPDGLRTFATVDAETLASFLA